MQFAGKSFARVRGGVLFLKFIDFQKAPNGGGFILCQPKIFVMKRRSKKQ